MIPILQQITPTIIIIKIEIIFPNTVATIIRYAPPFSLTVHFFNSYNTTYRYTGQQAYQHLNYELTISHMEQQITISLEDL